MKHIVFEYRDEFCKDGKFHRQECIVGSVEECIEIYGLNECEYRIISVEELSKGSVMNEDCENRT